MPEGADAGTGMRGQPLTPGADAAGTHDLSPAELPASPAGQPARPDNPAAAPPPGPGIPEQPARSMWELADRASNDTAAVAPLTPHHTTIRAVPAASRLAPAPAATATNPAPIACPTTAGQALAVAGPG